MSTAEWIRPAARPGRRLLRSVVGTLPDGTPHYAPVGTVIADGDHVLCHLCGDRFRPVLAHLRQHGWDQVRYREAFGLERGQPLEGETTRARRAAAFVRRRRSDPAVRAGCAVGRRWVASGELARAAGRAASGRRQPEQRRRKTLAALAAIPAQARAAGPRRAAHARLRRTARSGSPTSARWSATGWPPAPAWPGSAARPACTRTGCPGTWPPSTRPRPPRSPPGRPRRRTPGGWPPSPASATPTSPATSPTGPSPAGARPPPSPPRSA